MIFWRLPHVTSRSVLFNSSPPHGSPIFYNLSSISINLWPRFLWFVFTISLAVFWNIKEIRFILPPAKIATFVCLVNSSHNNVLCTWMEIRILSFPCTLVHFSIPWVVGPETRIVGWHSWPNFSYRRNFCCLCRGSSPQRRFLGASWRYPEFKGHSRLWWKALRTLWVDWTEGDAKPAVFFKVRFEALINPKKYTTCASYMYVWYGLFGLVYITCVPVCACRCGSVWACEIWFLVACDKCAHFLRSSQLRRQWFCALFLIHMPSLPGLLHITIPWNYFFWPAALFFWT